MNKTAHYDLPQWEAEDRILRTDFNAAAAAVDAALDGLQSGLDAANASVAAAKTELTASISASAKELETKVNTVNSSLTSALNTQKSSTWTKTETLTADTCKRFGAATTSIPNAILAKLVDAMPWVLIKSYKTAGSFTFTVPDRYGGKNYRLGVYMVGGGGSGAGITGSNGCASGGAAGYGKNLELTVTPGTKIALTVGAGGAAVTAPANGNAGGATSFNGTSVSGGEGGKYGGSQGSWYAASGGQGADGPMSVIGTTESRILYGGVATRYGYGGDFLHTYGGQSQPPRESQNRFDPSMVTLCAGGATGNGVQTIAAMPDGTKGGNGAQSNAVTTAAKGENATGNGNGGGSVRNTGGANASYPNLSGAGSPGMVLIYARPL